MANVLRIRTILSEAIDACWGQAGRTDAYQVIAYARRQHPEVFRQHARHLSDQAAYRTATALLKRAAAQTMAQAFGAAAQLDLPLAALPGESPPLAIAVDHHDDRPVEYVRFDCATWPDMQAGLAQREDNIRRAVGKRDDFVLKMDALRQYMEPEHGRTVAEACELLRKG
jgi:hypothetical protein